VSGERTYEVDFSGSGDVRVVTLPLADALPARIGLSAEFAATSALRLGADLARVTWKSAWAEHDEDGFLENGIDAALWGRLDLSERTLVSFGLLSLDRNRWGDETSEVFDYSGRAIFMTFGGAVTLDRFRLDAVVADSRLLSAAEQRQTLVKVGASVRL
jgi:hypothetical protein